MRRPEKPGIRPLGIPGFVGRWYRARPHLEKPGRDRRGMIRAGRVDRVEELERLPIVVRHEGQEVDGGLVLGGEGSGALEI